MPEVTFRRRWSPRNESSSMEALLTPSGYHSDGALESVAARAEKNSEVLGRLLTALVSKRLLTLHEALAIAGESVDEIIEVSE